MICPQCRTPAPDYARHCPRCGTVLSAPAAPIAPIQPAPQKGHRFLWVIVGFLVLAIILLAIALLLLFRQNNRQHDTAEHSRYTVDSQSAELEEAAAFSDATTETTALTTTETTTTTITTTTVTTTETQPLVTEPKDNLYGTRVMCGSITLGMQSDEVFRLLEAEQEDYWIVEQEDDPDEYGAYACLIKIPELDFPYTSTLPYVFAKFDSDDCLSIWSYVLMAEITNSLVTETDYDQLLDVMSDVFGAPYTFSEDENGVTSYFAYWETLSKSAGLIYVDDGYDSSIILLFGENDMDDFLADAPSEVF